MGKGHLAFWLPRRSRATLPLQPARADAPGPSCTAACARQPEARTPKAEPQRDSPLGRVAAGPRAPELSGPRRLGKGQRRWPGPEPRGALHSRGASLSRAPSLPGQAPELPHAGFPAPTHQVLPTSRPRLGPPRRWERAWRPAPSACPGRRRATWPFPGGGARGGAGSRLAPAAPPRPPASPDSPFPRGPSFRRRCGGSC